MIFYNNKYKDLITGYAINYGLIKDMDTLLISITLLSVMNELKLYNLASVDNMIDEIKNNIFV